MATKADYAESEWQVLQFAVTNTMAYLSMSDPGFWDTFKEASAAAKYIAEARSGATNLLVRDIAGDVKAKRDKEVTGNPADLAAEVTERVAEAATLVAAKDAGDSEAFKEFILGVAKATAEAVDGVVDHESEAIAKLTEALG